MKKSIFLLFSTGWLFPLFASIFLIINFMQNEIYPIIYKQEKIINSFPYINVANTLLIISLIWFILVLCTLLVKNIRK